MSGYAEISALLNSYFVSVFSEDEGGDLLKSSFSFPGTPEEEIGTDVISQITCSACAPRGWVQPWGAAGGCSAAQPPPATKPTASTAPHVFMRVASNLSAQPFLPGISHLLHQVRESKAEKRQIWVASGSRQFKRKRSRKLSASPSSVVSFYLYPPDNIIITERVFNVTS